MQKLDANGNFIWANSIANSSVYPGNTIAVDLFGNVYKIGNFYTSIDANPNSSKFILTPNGSSDVFILKLGLCDNTSSTISPTACYNYTSPSGKYVWTSSGTYTDIIPNQLGCDSIMNITLTINENYADTQTISACQTYVSPSGKYIWTHSGIYSDTIPASQICDSVITINLTIDSIDTSVSVYNNSLTSNEPNANYQWLDCIGYAIISGATNSTYTVTITGSYAVKISKNGCIDTSACTIITINGIIENNSSALLNIYPNPIQNNFSIDLGTKYEEITMTIKDIMDKKIQTSIYNNMQLLNIDMSSTPPGIYFLTIKIKDKQAVLKLVKV